ncbi:unnamed protein product [Ambrosiozyma monospora]|uniref:Unnamed protein product n=1 Tax=Ambrosiozyma monospora TaxID=43982 RepID=A0A9W6Z0J2_AMBMO|nr:unnamed protein product [Ambrosiozyma monospora]
MSDPLPTTRTTTRTTTTTSTSTTTTTTSTASTSSQSLISSQVEQHHPTSTSMNTPASVPLPPIRVISVKDFAYAEGHPLHYGVPDDESTDFTDDEEDDSK